VRISWVSPEAQKYWEPRFRAIADDLKSVERSRQAFIEDIPLNNLIPFNRMYSRQGYYQSILEMDSTKVKMLLSKKTPTFFNDISIGSLLDYPDCCISRFHKLWNEKQIKNFIPYQYYPSNPNNTYRLNMFHKHLGIRLVFHLPCSFECKQSEAIAITVHEQLIIPHRYIISEILNWPCLYTCTNGIAEIHTPVYKLVMSGDQDARVEYQGTIYPKYGANGLSFPYNQKDLYALKSDNWTVNGFSSEESMTKAHEVVLSLVKSTDNKVMDLGCGDGTLLEKIQQLYNLHIIGIDKEKYSKSFIITNDLRNWRGQFDGLIITSVQRIIEIPDLWSRIDEHAKAVIIYSYGGTFAIPKIDWTRWRIVKHAANETTEAFRVERA